MQESNVKTMGYRKKSSIGIMPWVYWGYAAFFFFAEYFVRVSTSVMASDLMRDFGVGALALGSLSAAFYYAYVGMQLPVGVLMDRYGPKKLLVSAIALCALGCIYFSQTNSLAMATIARFIIGFGAAFAFVGALKIATTWLPPKYLGILVGITQGLGMLGASVGEAPMNYVVEHIGWRHTMSNIALLFFALALLILFTMRNRPPKDSLAAQHKEDKVTIIAGLKIVLSNPQTWINACFAGLLYAPTTVFGELWGVSFLTQANGLEQHHAATAIGLIFIGWTLGGPLTGWFSDKIQMRRPVMMASALSGLIIIPMILYMDNLSFWVLSILLAAYGFLNSGLVASYATASELNPSRTSGVALGFTNMASVMIGAFFQPLIGFFLDMQWHGTLVNGAPVYEPQVMRNSMIILPVCFLLALLCAYKVKETHCRPLEEQ